MTTVSVVLQGVNNNDFSRVKFGDDPLVIHQPHIYAASTDTSMKMNQLAAKYLKRAPALQRATKPTTTTDMSFATRNYMERHKIVQGKNRSCVDKQGISQEPTALPHSYHRSCN